MLPIVLLTLTNSSGTPVAGTQGTNPSLSARQAVAAASIGRYQAAVAAAKAAAPARASTPKLAVFSAGLSMAGKNGPQPGDKPPTYHWLLNLDNTGNPTVGSDAPGTLAAAYSQNCHPNQSNLDGGIKLDSAGKPVANPYYPDGLGAGGSGTNVQRVPQAPLYGTSEFASAGRFRLPDPTTAACPWPSLHYEVASPVISEGDQTTWNSTTPLPPFAGATAADGSGGHGLPPGKYLVSITSDGYQIGGVHFTICPTADDPVNCPPPTPPAQFTVDQPQLGPGLISVGLNPYPLPLGTIRARAYADMFPTTGAYQETDPGLAGFRAHLIDFNAEVSVDYYGNPLCTEYQTVDGTPNTPIKIDAKGTPTPKTAAQYTDGVIPGQCMTGADGIVTIPNMPPNRYGVSLIPPQSQQGGTGSGPRWVQDETLEGNHDFDVWLMPSGTGVDTEQVVGGEPQPFVNFGFVPPINALPAGTAGGGSPVKYTATTVTDSNATWTANQWNGDKITSGIETAVIASTTPATATTPPTVTLTAAGWTPPLTGNAPANTAQGPPDGQAYSIHHVNGALPTGRILGQEMGSTNYVPGIGGIPGTGGNSGFSGIKLSQPPKNGWVSLSNMNMGADGMAVYAGPTDVNGKFDIPNVPDGDYLITIWDQPQDYALDQFNISVAHGQTVDVGVLPMLNWFTRVSGNVFVDLNGNGRQDPGEPGVPKFLIQNLNRTNNTYEQGQQTANTDDKGHYEITEGYPLGQFTVEQFFNTRYKTTGLTYQSCNDTQEHTIISPFVDVSFEPIIGQCGRVDIAVQPYDASKGDNGGIVATMLYDNIRMANLARQEVQFLHLTGIPGFTMDLYDAAKGTPDRNNPVGCFPYTGTVPAAGVKCADVNATDGSWVDAMGNVHNADGSYRTVQPSPLNGNGAAPAQAYTTENFGPPTGCVPLDANGKTVDNNRQDSVGVPGATPGYNPRCTESSITGVGIGGGTDNSAVFPGALCNLATGDTGGCHGIQTVDGNYGLDATDGTLCPKDPATQSPVFPTDPAQYTPGCFQNHTGDFVVHANIPTDNVRVNPATGKYDLPLFTVSTEEDVNIFTGDQWVPQGANPADLYNLTWPPKADPARQAPLGYYKENPGTTSAGPDAQCAGPSHKVNVTNPDFLAFGGSPFEGAQRNLCGSKLIHVESGQSVAPNFHVHTVVDVPIPGKYSGYIVDDVSASTDKKTTTFGEVSGIAGAPVGFYDWANNVQFTATSDYNGQFEALMPSTTSSNCLTPAGVCPNIYRLVGNDPGQPPYPNLNYNPSYKTIAANFQDWPGQFLAADVAPSKQIVNLEAAGAQFAYPPACNPTVNSPQIFAVDRPYRMVHNNQVPGGASETTPTLTIDGLGFGAAQGTSSTTRGQVTLTDVNNTVRDLGLALSWTDREIKIRIPDNVPPGAYQLNVVQNLRALRTTAGLTYHVVGTTNQANYNATILAVGPANDPRTFPTTPGVNAPAHSVTSSNQTAYTATSANDANGSLNGSWAGGSIYATNPTGGATIGTIQGNTNKMVTLTTAGWSNGTPSSGRFIVTPPPITSSTGTTYTARTATDLSLHMPNGAYAGVGAAVGDLISTPNGSVGVITANTGTKVTISAAGWSNGTPAAGTVFTILPNTNSFTVIQDALETAAGSQTTDQPNPGLPIPGKNPIAKALIVVYPALPSSFTPLGKYYENLIVHSPVKIQGVGPGGVYMDGSGTVQGTKVDGQYFWSTNTLPDATGLADAGPGGPETGTNEPYAAAWLTLAENILEHTGPNGEGTTEPIGWDGNRNIIEGETVYVVAKAGAYHDASASGFAAGFDGAEVSGGDQKDFPGNINEAFGTVTGIGAELPNTVPEAGEGLGTDIPGALQTQGGGFFINAYADQYQVTNNLIRGNSGTYGGAIRVGTPYANDAGPNPPNHGPGEDDEQNQTNTGVVIANNSIIGNGGTNLAGAIGLFSGSNGYQITQNTMCGNMSLEYGGAIGHYGLSGSLASTKATRFTATTATDNSLSMTPSGWIGSGAIHGTITATWTVGTTTKTSTGTISSNTSTRVTLNSLGWIGNGRPVDGAVFTLALSSSIDHNKIFLNGSSGEGGGVMIAGELPLAGNGGGQFGGSETGAAGVTPIHAGLSAGAGPVVIDSNRIVSNLADDDGGGIRFLMGGVAAMKVTNNVITNNVSSHEGGGISIDDTVNITIDRDTIARNITTATATTSDGSPAPAGISTVKNSDLLQAEVPGTPQWSDPKITNSIIWGNLAGSWASGGVVGIGLAGDTTGFNVWDVGTVDQSGLLSPSGSVLDAPANAIEGCNTCTDTQSGNHIAPPAAAPNFPGAFFTQIDLLQIRSYFRFRPSAIVNITVPGDAFGNYAATNYNGIGSPLPGGQ